MSAGWIPENEERGEIHFDLHMRAAVRLRGTVVDANGAPVEDSSVIFDKISRQRDAWLRSSRTSSP